MIRVAVVASTGGSVLNAVLNDPYVKPRLTTILSDRHCGAVEAGRRHDVVVHQCLTADATEFSNLVSGFFDKVPHDLVLSFYTKLFRGRLISQLQGRLVNFHPSILPACPGRHGFQDTVNAGARYIGATAHFVDAGTDTGPPILQAALPFNPNKSLAENRHAIFVAQCRMVIQVVRWFEEGRVTLDLNGIAAVQNGSYEIGAYAPNLDFSAAIDFSP